MSCLGEHHCDGLVPEFASLAYSLVSPHRCNYYYCDGVPWCEHLDCTGVSLLQASWLSPSEYIHCYKETRWSEYILCSVQTCVHCRLSLPLSPSLSEWGGSFHSNERGNDRFTAKFVSQAYNNLRKASLLGTRVMFPAGKLGTVTRLGAQQQLAT